MDHGKTALVYALTDVATDRLPEEQRRGITIELGFAPWRISDDVTVSVIDAPGHRRLVHTMIAGASGIDIVLLVVAADEGVMPQTREHIAACRLLGVKRAIVAVSKLDRVDAELAELAGEEARDLLMGEGIAATVVPCSAKSGQGLDAVRSAVLEAIAETDPRVPGRYARLSVDRVFSVHGSGTVITGTLVDGTIAAGQPLRIVGPTREQTAAARGLHVHGESLDEVSAPTRLAINLSGLATALIARGDVITNDPDVSATRVIDVWLDTPEPPKRGSEASIFAGTSRSTAKLQPLSNVTLEHGTLARVRLTAPMVVFGGDRFVLRGAKLDGPAGAVIGGGIVLDAHPPRRGRASKRADLLKALRAGDAEAAMLALTNEVAPQALSRKALTSRFAIEGEALLAAAASLAKSGALMKVGDKELTTPEALERLKAHACALVEEHHKKAPLEAGLPLQTLRDQLTRAAGHHNATAAMSQLRGGKSPRLIATGDCVQLPSFKGVQEDQETARMLGQAEDLVGKAGLGGMTEKALVSALSCDIKMARAMLTSMGREKKAVRSGELWFHLAAVKELQERVVAHLAARNELSVADFKTLTGLGRKQSIPLLEYFDRENVTRRQGDVRVKG